MRHPTWREIWDFVRPPLVISITVITLNRCEWCNDRNEPTNLNVGRENLSGMEEEAHDGNDHVDEG